MASKPLRRKKQLEVTEDLLSGQERILDIATELDVLSKDGSVDSVAKRVKHFRDCGCDGAIGGCCAVCGAISCVKCHGRCHFCAKSICLRHSLFMDAAGGARLRVCQACQQKLNRKRIGKVFVRALLWPFARFEE